MAAILSRVDELWSCRTQFTLIVRKNTLLHNTVHNFQMEIAYLRVLQHQSAKVCVII